MTPPMTPREKVKLTLKSWCEGGLLQDYASVTDAILTALASGSGDHAELEYYGYRAFNAGIGCCYLVANPGPSDTNLEPLVTAASAKALLAENAALRGQYELDGHTLQASVDRATEAERKLADARLNYEGALSDIDSLLTVLIRRINGEKDLASAAEWVRMNYPLAAEKIISKEAERG